MTARDRMVLLVLLAVAVVGGFWFAVLGPKREEAKELAAQVQVARDRHAAAEARVAGAGRARDNYDDDYAAVARLGKAVPVDDNVPSLVYQLESAARSARIDFRSVKLNNAGGAPPPAASTSGGAGATGSGASGSTATGSGSAASGGASGGSGATSGASGASGSTSGGSSAGGSASGASGSASGASGSASGASGSASGASGSASGASGATTPAATTTAPATQSAVAGLPPGATVGTAGFPTMPFSFVFDGRFNDMERFLAEIDRFIRTDGDDLRVRGRLLTIDGIALTASRKGFPRVKAAITATAYLLPAGEGLTAGATAQSPVSADATAPAAATTGTATR